jgi:probable F420-dependent oxidoreductase
VPIRFGVQAGLTSDARAWLDLARKVEDRGFHALYVADHPGSTGAPFPLLAAAGAVTERLRLGTYVVNCGVRDPVQLASDSATVDALSDGRLILGLGAGHTPGEWTMSGNEYPVARHRVSRLEEMLTVLPSLLAGEIVHFHGEHLLLEDAQIAEPRRVQARVPLLVGGNGRRVLDLAARHADIVSVTGLVRTLADGHTHEVDWRKSSIDAQITRLRARAAANLVVDALVQVVAITDDREAVAENLARRIAGLHPEDVLAAPFALVGTHEQIRRDLEEYERRWNITSYVVRSSAIDDTQPLVG